MQKSIWLVVSRAMLLIAAGAVGSALVSLGARAECAQPPHPPQMPQGATATDEEMKAGRVALQKYVNFLEDYGTCLDNELKGLPADAKPEIKAALVSKGDAAIEAAHEIADIYAIQLRAFKARQ